jgi:hypothetical protein
MKAWIALTRAFVRYPEGRSCVFRSKDKTLFLDLYEKRSKEGTAIKWLKFHTSYVFAKAWAQPDSELPVPPCVAFGPLEQNQEEYPLPDGERRGRFVGGHLGRALGNNMTRGLKGSTPYRRCAYDILMSKLGFPQAPPSFVEQTLKDHRAALTRAVEELSESDEMILDQVESKIAQICKRVFGHAVFRHRDPVPSIRACQENGLANAGGLGILVTGFNESHSYLVEEDTLVGMLEIRPGSARELRFVDMSARVTDFQKYVDELWVNRLDSGLHATPVPILEPLKVRVITKGEAAEYYRCIELQKLMHDALRKEQVFQCIGHPIEDDDWSNTFKSRAELADDEFYVSGDYKAATDNLNPRLSEYAWRCICSHVRLGWNRQLPMLWTKYHALGKKALTGHILHYGEDQVEQSWGQLMGSPMSFPILCIVNCAATLVALGLKYGPDVPVRVNGDDIAFIANPDSYARWKEVTSKCGLEFSLGKNYISRDFVIMNSELRRAPLHREWENLQETQVLYEFQGEELVEVIPWEWHPKAWKFEGFVNQCLLHNVIKKGMDAGQTKDIYWTDLSSISSEILRGMGPQAEKRLYHVFFKTYGDVIAEAPSLCNKWFPKSLGGMGLQRPQVGSGIIEKMPDEHAGCLEKQLKQAAYLACNPAVRMQRVTVRRQLFGPLDSLFKEVRELSDRQIPARLCRKPRNRENTPVMGGTTMLGYLLRLSAVDGNFGPEGRWIPTPLGGQRPERSGANHRAVAARLRQDYNKWLRKSLSHSLTPMRIENVVGYQEHLTISRG